VLDDPDALLPQLVLVPVVVEKLSFAHQAELETKQVLSAVL
jgi:hypothetical protein